MRVTTTFKDDYEFQSVNEEGNVLDIDMYSAEKKKHMSPTQLLLSSLAACASVDLVQMLKKRKKTVNGLTVVADGTRRDEHPRGFTHITLTFTVDSPDVAEAEFEKMGHLAATKYCSVAGTLSAEVDHKFIVNRA
ncbi:OsmC family protein [Roseivirga sp.]|uniref:OsmC family protein n=1 Tax=Roseivirga sp. TaxID=1964215 RepID=UPI002B2768F1|nr:OsmC family protein [Roseivirga sp.]